MTLLCSCLAYVGALSVTVVLYRLVNFVYVNLLASMDLKRRYAKAGDWAIVTGATEGIGYAMTMELARRGFNVCVIARTQSSLDEVVAEAKKKGVKGKAVAFDFAAADATAYKRLFAELDSLEVAVLVNNVGVNYPYANYFDEAEVEDDTRMLKVNCEASLRMTRFVVPRMKAKRSGGIVMLASVSAITPAPMLAVYAGTKAFSISFGQGLAYELKSFGIDVLVATPSFVVSKMTQGVSTRKPRESFMMVNAAAMARQTLNKLGIVTRTSGHLNHALVELITKALPESWLANHVLALNKAVKKRAERQRPQ
ncbi:short-chain dehydrogenase [Trypanosoma rangeli]|uniref:Short-chain dehydrogenase n=1 Tax=Trypanosoma rangeli TaxID=5698 RepID=A0A422NJG3_TRYRA|nr:short-chain dehydrogenase [Trypanosoma rangeli]RNF05605.1 short-chain dehydrogenase [Trypanosoma rangeli]|eukprot:RNF05605.1 short-chain dehydrogenase [Trypanosoma rangeli]